MATLQYGNIDAGIAQAEGFNTPGTIPNLANNPGDIIAGPFATSMGAKGSITAAGGQQIATFPDPATGYAATDALVAQKFSSGAATDIPSLASSWLGTTASPADVANWANAVSSVANPSTTPTATPSATPSASITNPSTWAPAIASSLGLTPGRLVAWILGTIFFMAGLLALAAGAAFSGLRAAEGAVGLSDRTKRAAVGVARIVG